MAPLRATFLMEQHLGHQTYYQNLSQHIDQMSELAAHWAPITYVQPGSFIERIPGLPRGLRGTLCGTLQARTGLRAQADVLFFNTQVPAALAASSIAARPYLVATDLTPVQYDAISSLYGHRPDRPGLLSAYKHRINKLIFRGAYRVLPWSSWARDSMIVDYGVDADRIEILAPGVDLTLWRPIEQKTASTPRILFVGGDFERKGGGKLLSAFRRLPENAAELHIVTRSAVPPERGVYVHHGMRPNSPELIALYSQSDVFVLPTEAEAFGIAAIEACAVGLPVIATRTGGLVDIVEEGENGFLLPPGDQDGLFKSLSLLTGEPELRRTMGSASRKRAESRFDAAVNARRVAQLLDDAAQAKKSR